MNFTRAAAAEATLTFVCLLFAGCQPSVDAAEPQSDQATSSAADIEAIKQQSALFSRAYVDGDLDAQMTIYAVAAVIAPPGGSFMSGEALRRYWAPAPGRAVVRHQTIPVQIVVEGDVAYDWGRYEGASGPIGTPSEFYGKYLIVWKRDSDGTWRMVQDMWNAAP